MTRSEYITAIAASPWRFPDVDGLDDVPAEWAAEAWDLSRIRSPIVDELRRGVSKMGALSLGSERLDKMSKVLRTDQVVALYEALVNDSPHRESEFRDDFLEHFSTHAAELPNELTRAQALEKLLQSGIEQTAATEILGDA